MSEAVIRLWPELTRATINPNLYGHFAEHLGRCIYEGIWVGPDKSIPNHAGLRLDVLAALKQLRAPVLRWPGGCFADDYHWRCGVGAKEKRPTTVNLWWQHTEPNEFGTNEFINLCRALDCEPYLCCNVGSGSPREARDWLEYCNFTGNSSLTRLRAATGTPEPYGVKYWGVGNENWGCGGRFSPENYAQEYTRYACYMRALDPSIQLIASGTSYGDYKNPILNVWNHDFCEKMVHADLIDHLSMHRYFSRGGGVAFSDAEYHGLFADLVALERDLTLCEAVLAYFYPDKQVGIIFDEWGVWHPEATVANGLEQPNTLRDAVFAGAALNLFNRWSHRVTMANIAQTINVLQCMAVTNGDSLYLTPTYHVFDMMRRHMGAVLLTQELEAPTYEAHPIGLSAKHGIPMLSASASISGKRVHLTVANQTATTDIETRIVLRNAAIASVAGRMLDSSNPRDVNTFENPKRVSARRVKVDLVKKELVVTFPKHSFTALSITLE